MKMAGLLTMFIALLIAPIVSVYGYTDKNGFSYEYSNTRPSSDLVPRLHNVTDEEIEEQELRRLLIERLRQENQSHARGEMSYADDSIVEKIKDMPWWGWIIVGFIGLAILGKFADD